ncbi:hypothetical protein Cgig2_000258 [Carnegiea gigantea]|uniref:Beta-galactosidase n=1 Tax=Carnegiea gigantea TaxID=171969 RepID=A0A9Q1JIF3_9CARY|nr:hypothetical protein Cgig2_000258 [Carnegiea gigantea]
MEVRWWVWVVVVVAVAAAVESRGSEVTYDGRSLIIDGQRRLLFSGSIHYPRSTPEMWPSLIAKAKEGGLDVIQTYVFWNLHEPQPGQYDFSGRRDLVKFIKEIHAQGLYVCLRIGPYIESEWTYGGFPFWLHDIPGISYRTDNEPFKFYMQNFTTKIVNLMKSEGLYASQGGPIILSQIENEYQNIEAAFGDKGRSYVQWAAKMAVGLQTGVPWVMCKQTDAPDPVYHGGTNFGRTASAYVTTSYYDQAPIDEYGLLRQPKWGHLKELHTVIKASSKTLLEGQQSNFALGQLQEAYVFQDETEGCVAFLVNNDTNNVATIEFQNGSYDLPPRSISILPNCSNEVFNTAKVTAESGKRITKLNVALNSAERWKAFSDPIPNFSDTSLETGALLEHMSLTKDKSDYLWFTIRFQPDSSCTKPVLNILSFAHAAHAFVNGTYAGGAHGNHDVKNFMLETPIPLDSGMNYISILSVMAGLPIEENDDTVCLPYCINKDSGAFLERRFAGLRQVGITCEEQSYNLTANYSWGYQVGLKGEELQIYKEENLGSAIWSELEPTAGQPLTWYQTTFDSPTGDDPVALNLSAMGKGEAWVNGQSIGRYWVSLLTAQGKPSQTLYHVPRSFLKTSDNLLVVLEEITGDPLGVSVDAISTTYTNNSSNNVDTVTSEKEFIIIPKGIQK